MYNVPFVLNIPARLLLFIKLLMYLDPEGNGRQRHSKITATVGLVVHAAGNKHL